MEQDRITDLSTVFREDVEQDVDLIVQDKLAKAGLTEEILAGLASMEEIQAVMKPVESEADMKALQKVLTPIVTTRNRIKLICKKGREHSNMVSKAFIAKEKEYVAMVATVEDPLTRYKDAWRAEQDRIKAEEDAEAKRVLQQRYAELEAIGMVRRTATLDAPERYEIGGVMLPVDRIDSADLGAWMHMTDTAKAEADRINAERMEAERKAKEEADKVAAQLAALAEREAKMKGMILSARTAVLKGAGLDVLPIGLADMTDEAFDAYVEAAQAEKAQAARKDSIAESVATLKGIGYREEEGGGLILMDQEGDVVTVDPAALYPVDQALWSKLVNAGNAYMVRQKEVEAERLRKEGEERERQRIEQERVEKERHTAALNDIGKWDEWVASIRASAPVMDSEVGKSCVSRLLMGLDRIATSLTPQAQ